MATNIVLDYLLIKHKSRHQSYYYRGGQLFSEELYSTVILDNLLATWCSNITVYSDILAVAK